jgi:cobalamin biosynthesis Mg chelatase CobN
MNKLQQIKSNPEKFDFSRHRVFISSHKMSATRTAGTAAPSWSTASTAPVSERFRSGGAFTDAEEARIREKVLGDKKGGYSVWMILGLILLLIIIFALLWFFFRGCGWGCGTGGYGGGCCNKCGKKKNKCSCGGSGGSNSDSD